VALYRVTPNGKLLKRTKDTEYKGRLSHVFRALLVREFEERNSLAVKLASSNICIFIPLSQLSDNSSGEHLGPAIQAMAAEFIPGVPKLPEDVSAGPATFFKFFSQESIAFSLSTLWRSTAAASRCLYQPLGQSSP